MATTFLVRPYRNDEHPAIEQPTLGTARKLALELANERRFPHVVVRVRGRLSKLELIVHPEGAS